MYIVYQSKLWGKKYKIKSYIFGNNNCDSDEKYLLNDLQKNMKIIKLEKWFLIVNIVLNISCILLYI